MDSVTDEIVVLYNDDLTYVNRSLQHVLMI